MVLKTAMTTFVEKSVFEQVGGGGALLLERDNVITSATCSSRQSFCGPRRMGNEWEAELQSAALSILLTSNAI